MYIVFILQYQKPQNNCQIVHKRTETSSFEGVLCEVSA
jgi:hypothetical protein